MKRKMNVGVGTIMFKKQYWIYNADNNISEIFVTMYVFFFFFLIEGISATSTYITGEKWRIIG